MKPICDFCSDQNVVHRYPAEDFVMAASDPIMTSEGHWYACQKCVELITLGKWNELANHAADMS